MFLAYFVSFFPSLPLSLSPSLPLSLSPSPTLPLSLSISNTSLPVLPMPSFPRPCYQRPLDESTGPNTRAWVLQLAVHLPTYLSFLSYLIYIKRAHGGGGGGSCCGQIDVLGRGVGSNTSRAGWGPGGGGVRRGRNLLLGWFDLGGLID